MTDETPLPAAVLAALLARMEEDRAGEGLQSVESYQALSPGYEETIARKVAEVVRGDTVGGEGGGGLLKVGATFGSYRVEAMLGQGGQGVVYKARDERLNRSVALKILDIRGPGLGAAINRFQREAEVAARLQHPGICSVYESGIEDGVPFIAMQLVEGKALSDAINAMRDATGGATESFHASFDDDLDVTDDEADDDSRTATDLSGPDGAKLDHLLRIVEQIARALHAAHEAGVVHRDIKPGNVMIRDDDTPVILDFGLAHDTLGEGVTLTRAGDLFGTPAYMSPEQLLHNAVTLDRRTDVWSLGVVLYEFLTYRRPFDSPTRQGLFQTIATREPSDPRKLNPAISKDLAVVMATALEKDRDRRYQTALDLAEELRRVREHEPIKARAASALTRLARWGQRNPALATMTGAAALILIVGASAATAFALRAEANAAKAAAHLTEWERLADGRRLDDRREEADGPLWPVVPKNIPAYRAWLDKTRALTARLPEHEAALKALRVRGTYDADEDRARMAAAHARLGVIHAEVAKAEATVRDAEGAKRELSAELAPLETKEDNDDLTSGEARALQRLRQRIEAAEVSIEDAMKVVAGLIAERTRLEAATAVKSSWAFTDEGDQLRHDKLRDLVSGLVALTAEPTAKTVTVSGMEQRLTDAVALERRLAEDDAEAWRRCLADLSRPEPPYHDLEFKPIPALVPLGRDRDSGLWEFWHVASGQRPQWEGEPLGPGKVKLHPDSGAEGMVMVLIPAGTFRMGAISPDKDHPAGSPNVDDQVYDNEGPVHEVTLDAYLIAKHEVTQGQWKRLSADSPSHYRAGETHQGERMTPRMPVTNVSWPQSREACRRWGLELPTESQWARACRGGTTTRFSTGDDLKSLTGYANIGDDARARRYSGGTLQRDFNDGFINLAPVGALKPNPFGLHDVHGNVWEWCLDGYGLYAERRPRAGDGLGTHWLGARFRVRRGGCFRYDARLARSAVRFGGAPGFAGFFLGLRPARRITP